MKKKKLRYEGYIVQDEDGVIRQVEDLTEFEAKVELAKAIDCIESMEGIIASASEVYKKWASGGKK